MYSLLVRLKLGENHLAAGALLRISSDAAVLLPIERDDAAAEHWRPDIANTAAVDAATRSAAGRWLL